MRALIDGDILRYEIGFAAETAWKAVTGDEAAIPPFDFVRDMLNQRIGYIKGAAGAHHHTIFVTEGETFRFDIAKKKPYKGNRVENKPWHFDNLTMYLKDIAKSQIVTFIEADDAMAIEHLRPKAEEEEGTIICSRDKDLRQVPGWFFSWELGRQPSYGPVHVKPEGLLNMEMEKKKLSGNGYAFFCAQVLMGDPTDNIPGLPKMGPVGAYDLLKGLESPEAMEDILVQEYRRVYPDNWESELTEQAQLLWLVRRLNPDGSPELWRRGLYV